MATSERECRERDKDEAVAEVRRLEEELDDLKKRWPAHSVKPQMVAELERLEEALEDARRRLADRER